MASLHLGIRDAVAALLSGLSDVYENRELALEEGKDSQIQVFRTQSTPERILLGPNAPVDWTTEVRIVVKARSEAAADDLACSVYAAVMSNQQLGGLADLVEPGPMAWEQDEVAESVHVVTFDISVRHRTEHNGIAQ